MLILPPDQPMRRWSEITRWLRVEVFGGQAEMGDAIGVAQSTVSGWEHGDRTGRSKHLTRLLDVLQLDESEPLARWIRLVNSAGADGYSGPMPPGAQAATQDAYEARLDAYRRLRAAASAA